MNGGTAGTGDEEYWSELDRVSQDAHDWYLSLNPPVFLMEPVVEEHAVFFYPA